MFLFTRQTRETPAPPQGKTRESSAQKGPSPHMLPSTSENFAPLRSSPFSSKFCTPCSPAELKEDQSIAITIRKQLKLLTIHERLGHVSFSVLKLMARANIIPHELASVDPPVCTGCAYGKARHKPWRCKRIRNLKSLRQAAKPGVVGSIEQLTSPPPGHVST